MEIVPSPDSSPSRDSLPLSPIPLDESVMAKSRKRKTNGDPVERKAKTPKIVIRPKEVYGIYDPEMKLEVDTSLKKYLDNGIDRKMFWYFILTLLIDPAKKEIISWTGRGLEFVILSPDRLTLLWSESQQKKVNNQWDSVRRNFRSCYKKRVFIPVKAIKNIFAFVTEPTYHIGWKKEDLVEYIK
ncbi:hypothetical protein PENTCL1PPCAC_26943, partial [Pristionchus entomophagus]